MKLIFRSLLIILFLVSISSHVSADDDTEIKTDNPTEEEPECD